MSEDDYDAKRTLLKSEEQDILKKIDFLLTKNWDFKLNYELNKLKNRLNENTILNHNYDENVNNLKIKLNLNDILNYNYEENYRKYNRNYIEKQMFREAFNLNSIDIQYNQTYKVIQSIDSHTLVKEIETSYLAKLISKMDEFYKKVMMILEFVFHMDMISIDVRRL